MTEWAARLIADRRVAAVPIMTHPGIELTGRTVLEAVSDGRVHADAVKALADKYPSAAATVIMDLTVEAEAFGADIAFERDEVPAVRGHLLSGVEDIDLLEVPSLRRGRVPQYIKASMLAAREITDRPVFAGCIGPFSLAGRLYDMSEIMMLIIEHPDAARRLLTKCTDFILKYCLALKAAGANGVVMAEPAAGLLSDDDCREFSSVFVKRIVDAVQDDEFAVVFHNCGDCTIRQIDSILRTGALAYHFGNSIDMSEMMKHIPSDVLVMGNVDPAAQFRNGTPESIKAETKRIMGECCRYPNFVISSGCDIPPMSPWENIDAFFEAAAEFYGDK